MHHCHTQGRVQAVCQQLQADISRMKSARAAVQRRMESKEKEFREWRLMREREVLQLRRNAQRQSAALQQHQAMHSKQQVRMCGSCCLQRAVHVLDFECHDTRDLPHVYVSAQNAVLAGP
jgi:predicted RNase H-like nuclease (RuvC/YqgF family)